ncbi:Ribonuclease H2 subunit B-like protein [Emericellopsis cladophorae]|uniref:Ribonuclease H2 subunit B n=1 Tax=Emericellopsis cladophorae TaxID=2686198 RepID=A0A9P9Y6H9_9HYPO|nr:Ribonuclease H2 subunit B-like protein [Emericellopsis cladophorae]KAI6784240.1 Ribonuclease H2 subunit B-like protein [Emericellopsis cladophorae]
MPRTRTAKAAAPSSPAAETPKASSSKYSLEATKTASPKLFVLPKAASKEAKIVTLPNPRTAKPSRYLVCPQTGFYEFTKIAAPNSVPRSWLIETTHVSQRSGHTISDAECFIASPLDPVFLLLPSLAESSIAKGSDDKKKLFLSGDDYFDQLPTEYSHLEEILQWTESKSVLESRMAAICDTVDAGDEKMFRINREKLVMLCLSKARTLSGSLPVSVEKQFVAKALQAPVVNQRRAPVQKSASTLSEAPDSGTSTLLTESLESQSSAATIETAATSVDQDTVEVEEGIKPTEEVVELQRLRVALDFICDRYISPAVTQWLKEGLASSNVQFSALDEYLARVTELRAEALALRSLGDYSRKHMRDEDDDDAREQKKRKMEDEKRRKQNQSRGVRDLKKVNTTGMMKLSSFFQKK